jgi:hypothetical protein
MNCRPADSTTGGSSPETYREIRGGDALFSHLDFSFSTSHPRSTLVDRTGRGGGSPALRRHGPRERLLGMDPRCRITIPGNLQDIRTKERYLMETWAVES